MKSPSSDRKPNLSSGNRSRSRSRSCSPRRVKVSSRRVVIANIPYHVTWNKLKQIFRDQLGFTGYLRLMKTNGRPNGMGLMEFKSVDGAEKAIEKMHRFEIGDRRIIVREETLRDQERMATMEFDGPSNQGMDGGGMAPPASSPGIPPQARNSSANPVPAIANVTPNMLEGMGIRGPITDSLYISNLDYGVDWRKIKDIFKLAGRVIHASVKQDDEGRSRGVAVVRFEHPYEALLALSMFNGQTINDRPIRVKIDRDGTHAPPNHPVFPPTPQGAAAAASFMAHFNNATINAAAAAGKTSNGHPPFGVPGGGGISGGGGGGGGGAGGGFLPPQQPPVSSPPGTSPALAAAMAALLSSAGRGMPPQELLGSLLGGSGVGGGANSMGGGGGFPVGGGGAMNPLSQLMGLQGGAVGPGSGPVGGYGGALGGDRSRDANATLQQLLMAAAAGGMSQEQIAQAVSALGLNREAPGLPPYSGMGGMINSPVGGNDPYGDRGGMGGGGGGDMQSRRPLHRPDYDSRSRFRDGSGSRGGYRQMSSDGRGGPRGGPMGRGDSDRMYIRR
uniref:Protein kinase domain-containing protein n=1 Tax=Mesocestoides corti TaxID=53468 RepID=A0A5K3FAF7_MESCO